MPHQSVLTLAVGAAIALLLVGVSVNADLAAKERDIPSGEGRKFRTYAAGLFAFCAVIALIQHINQ